MTTGVWRFLEVHKREDFGEVLGMMGDKSGAFLSLLLFDSHHSPEPCQGFTLEETSPRNNPTSVQSGDQDRD